MQPSFSSPRPLCLVVLGVGLAALLMGGVPAQAGNVSSNGAQEAQFLDLINDYRADSDRCWTGDRWRSWPRDALRTLARSATLDQAARDHNVVMIEGNCFGHRCDGEPKLPERVEAAGYPATWRHLSENIAGGFQRASAVLQAWKDSEGHNRTMLDCRMRAIGIARTDAPQSKYHWLWTTDFGDVVDAQGQGNGGSEEDPILAVLREYDANANDRLDRPEFNEIVAAWNAGRLSDRAVQKAYELYRSGTSLGSAGGPSRLALVQDASRARFAWRGLGIRDMHVRIYDLAGDLVYNGRTPGSELVWRLQNQRGEPVANGVYLYVVQAATSQGLRHRVGRMTVLQ